MQVTLLPLFFIFLGACFAAVACTLAIVWFGKRTPPFASVEVFTGELSAERRITELECSLAVARVEIALLRKQIHHLNSRKEI